MSTVFIRPAPDCIQVTREARYVSLVMLGFVVLGLWQHLYFSYAMREFAFFKNAFDEDTYVLSPFVGFRLDRALSGFVVSSLLWLSNGSYNFTLIFLDATLPPIIFLAAYFVGTSLFAKFPARCLFALFLVFASDLFSLGSLASYPGPFPTFSQFKALVGASYVPPIDTSYLAIYRSPEPQVSYVVGFVLISLLLRTVLDDSNDMKRRQMLALAAAQALLLTCYALISYPILLVEGCAIIALLAAGRWRTAFVLGVLWTGSIVIAILAARITLGTSFMFASRLPIITVGVILALLLAATFLGLLLKQGRCHPRLMIGLAFAIVPIVLTNQQVVTGWMISTKEWERHINLAFVVISGGILASHLRWRSIWLNPLITLAAIFVVGFVVQSSKRTYLFWLPDNLKSLAMARAIAATGASGGGDAVLVLQPPHYASFVEARMGHTLRALIDYADVFKNPIASTPSFKTTPQSGSLFEYWRQTGVTPETARQILTDEANQQNGFYSAFLFNVCEYWSPCTDGRDVKTQKIVAAIPTVIDDYAAFLATPTPRSKFVFVTLGSTTSSERVEIGRGQADSVVATVSVER